MPVHDWTRVPAGIFHDFHMAWLGTLRGALNGGALPPDYYALIDQDAGEIGPDVLTLRAGERGAAPDGNVPLVIQRGEQQHLCNQHNCTLIPAAALPGCPA